MDIIQSIIELENCKRQLDRIQHNPEYINNKVMEIYGDRPKTDHTEQIKHILDSIPL